MTFAFAELARLARYFLRHSLSLSLALSRANIIIGCRETPTSTYTLRHVQSVRSGSNLRFANHRFVSGVMSVILFPSRRSDFR